MIPPVFWCWNPFRCNVCFTRQPQGKDLRMTNTTPELDCRGNLRGWMLGENWGVLRFGWTFFSRIYSLSPLIMEVENGYIWKVTTIGGTNFWLPWLWEEVYRWGNMVFWIGCFFWFFDRYVLSFGILDLKKRLFWIGCFFVVHRYGLMRL